MVHFKGVDETQVQSNKYYTHYGSGATVDNLAWSADHILATHDNNLRDMVRGGIFGVPPIESGGSLVLKLMFDGVMDDNNSALRALTEGILKSG